MEDFLNWIYGRALESLRIKILAKKCIGSLAQRHSMTTKELVEELDIGYNQHGKPKRTLYKVVGPLKRVKLVTSLKHRNGNRIHVEYFLTPDKFEGYMLSKIEDVKRSAVP